MSCSHFTDHNTSASPFLCFSFYVLPLGSFNSHLHAPNFHISFQPRPCQLPECCSCSSDPAGSILHCVAMTSPRVSSSESWSVQGVGEGRACCVSTSRIEAMNISAQSWGKLLFPEPLFTLLIITPTHTTIRKVKLGTWVANCLNLSFYHGDQASCFSKGKSWEGNQYVLRSYFFSNTLCPDLTLIALQPGTTHPTPTSPHTVHTHTHTPPLTPQLHSSSFGNPVPRLTANPQVNIEPRLVETGDFIISDQCWREDPECLLRVHTQILS